MNGPVSEHDPDTLRLRIGLPHVLVKVHQLLDTHFGPRLEQDASDSTHRERPRRG
jgi:hypothetical protein